MTHRTSASRHPTRVHEVVEISCSRNMPSLARPFRAPWRRLVALLPACSLTVVATAQNTWRLAAPTGPGGRYTVTAYDSLRDRVTLFGGDVGGSLSMATWEWNGAAWTQASTVGPQRRRYHAMAYDPNRQRVVMFGGQPIQGPPAVLNDTWEWDGTNWTQMASGGPPVREMHQMVFDANRGRVVLFGGQKLAAPTTFYNDTWEWTGTSWVQLANGPSGRSSHGMAFDAVRNRTVVFGGFTSFSGNPVGDTWEFNGVTWSQVATTGPSARGSLGMAFANDRGRVVLFGGFDGQDRNDTWEWNGASWTQQSPGSSPVARNSAAVCRFRNRVLLYGGFASGNYFDDTFEYALAARTRPVGPGCSGTAGTPLLSPSGTGPLPLLGANYVLSLTNLPASGAVSGLLGFAEAVPPVPLDAIGMPGCSYYLSGTTVSIGLVNNGGSATWSTAVPLDPSLVGLPLVQQAIVVDPPANALGVTVSSAVEGIVGY